jgi:hypothetical protein
MPGIEEHRPTDRLSRRGGLCPQVAIANGPQPPKCCLTGRDGERIKGQSQGLVGLFRAKQGPDGFERSRGH